VRGSREVLTAGHHREQATRGFSVSITGLDGGPYEPLDRLALLRARTVTVALALVAMPRAFLSWATTRAAARGLSNSSFQPTELFFIRQTD
jgi:hypothetical protein